MTLKEAITIAQNKMEIDYSGMEKQREVDELDEALDLIFKTAIKETEEKEWLPEKIRTGKVTIHGWCCERCGLFSERKWWHCPLCGSPMKTEEQKP